MNDMKNYQKYCNEENIHDPLPPLKTGFYYFLSYNILYI